MELQVVHLFCFNGSIGTIFFDDQIFFFNSPPGFEVRSGKIL